MALLYDPTVMDYFGVRETAFSYSPDYETVDSMFYSSFKIISAMQTITIKALETNSPMMGAVFAYNLKKWMFALYTQAIELIGLSKLHGHTFTFTGNVAFLRDSLIKIAIREVALEETVDIMSHIVDLYDTIV